MFPLRGHLATDTETGEYLTDPSSRRTLIVQCHHFCYLGSAGEESFWNNTSWLWSSAQEEEVQRLVRERLTALQVEQARALAAQQQQAGNKTRLTTMSFSASLASAAAGRDERSSLGESPGSALFPSFYLGPLPSRPSRLKKRRPHRGSRNRGRRSASLAASRTAPKNGLNDCLLPAWVLGKPDHRDTTTSAARTTSDQATALVFNPLAFPMPAPGSRSSTPRSSQSSQVKEVYTACVVRQEGPAPTQYNVSGERQEDEGSEGIEKTARKEVQTAHDDVRLAPNSSHGTTSNANASLWSDQSCADQVLARASWSTNAAATLESSQSAPPQSSLHSSLRSSLGSAQTFQTSQHSRPSQSGFGSRAHRQSSPQECALEAKSDSHLARADDHEGANDRTQSQNELCGPAQDKSVPWQEQHNQVALTSEQPSLPFPPPGLYSASRNDASKRGPSRGKSAFNWDEFHGQDQGKTSFARIESAPNPRTLQEPIPDASISLAMHSLSDPSVLPSNESIKTASLIALIRQDGEIPPQDHHIDSAPSHPSASLSLPGALGREGQDQRQDPNKDQTQDSSQENKQGSTTMSVLDEEFSYQVRTPSPHQKPLSVHSGSLSSQLILQGRRPYGQESSQANGDSGQGVLHPSAEIRHANSQESSALSSRDGTVSDQGRAKTSTKRLALRMMSNGLSASSSSPLAPVPVVDAVARAEPLTSSRGPIWTHAHQPGGKETRSNPTSAIGTDTHPPPLLGKRPRTNDSLASDRPSKRPLNSRTSASAGGRYHAMVSPRADGAHPSNHERSSLDGVLSVGSNAQVPESSRNGKPSGHIWQQTPVGAHERVPEDFMRTAPKDSPAHTVPAAKKSLDLTRVPNQVAARVQRLTELRASSDPKVQRMLRSIEECRKRLRNVPL